jgi:antitoxin ChpS
LVVDPKVKPRYTLDELLVQCDADAPISDEDRAWLDMPPIGREL